MPNALLSILIKRPIPWTPPCLRKSAIMVVMLFLTSLSVFSQKPLLDANNVRQKGLLRTKAIVYENADSRSFHLTEIEQNTIVYLFKVGKGKSESKNGYYRIGLDPYTALGWINSNRLLKWNNRFCLHFTNRDNRPQANVFKTSRQAINASVYKTSTDSPIAQEPPGLGAYPEPEMLLPVINQVSDFQKGKRVTAYNVAYLGTENPIIQREKEIALLEIVFVMDATQSMSNYIENTSHVVSEIANRASGMRESGVYFSLLAYRDHYMNDQSKFEYVTKRFSDLTPNVTQIEHLLNSELVATEHSTQGVPEALFDAINEAIEDTNWDTKKSSLRVVILVGDASGHELGSSGNPNKLSKEMLLKKASENRVRFIAIKINSAFDDDNQIHRQQLQGLTDGLSAGDKGYYRAVDRYNILEYKEELSAAVENELVNMQRLLECINGDCDKDKSFDNKAVILKVLEKTSKEIQFNQGWVSETNSEGQFQVKPYVFMTYQEVSAYLNYLNSFIGYGQTTNVNTIKQVLAKTGAAQTGDLFEESISMKKMLERNLSLPVQSGLLRHTFQEIKSWSQTKRATWAKELQDKRRLIEQFAQNPENWREFSQSNYKFTFIPIDIFP